MSYLLTIEYKIIPQESYKIIRNCAGCKGKSHYVNTGNFRVNANGNKIDVWLIYQCEKCKHTYNLPVYERVNPTQIDAEAYRKFLGNDKEFAFSFGTDKRLLSRNKVIIENGDIPAVIRFVSAKTDGKTDEESMGEVSIEHLRALLETGHKIEIIIHNPYALKVRNDKLISEIFKVSRSSAKKLTETIKVRNKVYENTSKFS